VYYVIVSRLEISVTTAMYCYNDKESNNIWGKEYVIPLFVINFKILLLGERTELYSIFTLSYISHEEILS
jgi:hypothetical protein